jgi:hypothetical protein
MHRNLPPTYPQLVYQKNPISLIFNNNKHKEVVLLTKITNVKCQQHNQLRSFDQVVASYSGLRKIKMFQGTGQRDNMWNNNINSSSFATHFWQRRIMINDLSNGDFSRQW